MTKSLDWPGLMRAGLHGLGLAPEVFWRLTPIELRVMLGMAQTTPQLTRARLEELAARFPDFCPLQDAGKQNATNRRV